MSDDQMRNTIAAVRAIAAFCHHEMQGRLVDDEHRRAFRALALILWECERHD